MDKYMDANVKKTSRYGIQSNAPPGSRTHSRSLESLFLELARKSSAVPVWLSIAPEISIIPGSGLVPILPEFQPHSLPVYRANGSETPASQQLVDIDFLVGATEVVLHTFADSVSFELCGTILGIRENNTIIATTDGNLLDLNFSTAEASFSADCILSNKVGKLAVIAGQQWKKTSPSDRILDLTVVFLDLNGNGEWEKVGQGRIAIQEYERELLARVKRRHVKVGNEIGRA